ncbi:mandelate racemase/muconate lactonizing enzyme family protein [Acerihabitans sp.]|uniref:mandelate racemase/muconate lactonizing enzyme family protein n=1 Tax=Acerihabitans sp. TaxID=2811394 RepID=UPI002EDABA26
MKISNVNVSVYRTPPSVAWEDATNKVQGIEFIIVEILTDTIVKGTGFTYSVDVGGTAIASLIENYLAPLVIDMDPLDNEKIWNKLQRQSRRLGVGANLMAIAAIDIAIWDIKGKIFNQPLYKIFGGMRSSIPSYISEINLRKDDTLDNFLDRVDEYIARGYQTIKFKIGRDDIEEDIERIVRAKEKLGNGGKLLVDLNQKWLGSDAIVNCAKLDVLGLGWIEEPLLHDNLQGYVGLKSAIRTPLAHGESMHSRAQFLAYLNAGAIDFVQADVAFVGGFTEWLKIANLSQAFGKQVAPHYMMELSVHMLCGVPNGFMLENVIGGSFQELGIAEGSVTIENGIAYPSEKPGHGIEFDEKALKSIRLDAEDVKKSFKGGSK